MQASNFTYPFGLFLISAGGWALKGHAFGVMLADDRYAPAPKHRVVSDVGFCELTGDGYARQPLKGRLVRLASDGPELVASPVSFTGLNVKGSYRWAIVFRDRSADHKSELVCAIDMDHVDLNRITSHRLNWDRDVVMSLSSG